MNIQKAEAEHHAAERFGPQERDVARGGEIDEYHHEDRQRSDDGGGRFRFLRHRLDLGFHLLAIAQHARQVVEGFREVAAGPLLDGDDDAKEVRLRHRKSSSRGRELYRRRTNRKGRRTAAGTAACWTDPAGSRKSWACTATLADWATARTIATTSQRVRTRILLDILVAR